MKPDKLIINAAITGMVPTHADSPNVPCSVDEIVADAKRCFDAGASIVHVHARDKKQMPTHKGKVYKEIIQGIRETCPGMLISGTTSGRLNPELEPRSEVLQPGPGLHPDFGSLTLGSLNFPTGASVNQPSVIQGLAKKMKEHSIVPEWEIFDFGMIDYAKYLIKKNILVRPFYGNILLGSLGTAEANAYNLASMVNALPQGTTWSATGIGRFQFYINCLAVSMGGHVRVGLEDNLWYDHDRTQLATNAGMVERIVNVARSMGREIASTKEARKIIGIKKSHDSIKTHTHCQSQSKSTVYCNNVIIGY